MRSVDAIVNVFFFFFFFVFFTAADARLQSDRRFVGWPF